MITYESLCEKVGFDIMSYKGKPATTEDDNWDDPKLFSVLTIEELNFLMDYMRNEIKKKKQSTV